MLNAKEAQAMLGVSIGYIYSLARSGAIAYYRFGRTIRFEEAHLLAYKESCAVAAKAPKEVTVTRLNVSLVGEKSALQNYFEKAKLEKVKNKL
jgi:excisionase family DNA binding protein